VCVQRARTVRFDCGHRVCCTVCSEALVARAGGCPICRSPISQHLFRSAEAAEAPQFIPTHAASVAKLQHDDAMVRATALRRLDASRCGTLVPSISPHIGDADHNVRLAAIALLQRMGRSQMEGSADARAALKAAGVAPTAAAHAGVAHDLRLAIAEVAPYLASGDYARCNAIFRAAAERHSASYIELRTALQTALTSSEDARWIAYNVYRRSFDVVIPRAERGSAGDSGGEPSGECYMYYWDERDGAEWMGWWVTPDDVGSMRYWAFARGSDTATPDGCAAWESAGRRLQLKVTKGADGSILLEPSGPSGSPDCPLSFLGTYKPVAHTHTHRGRLVYRRTAPLPPPLPPSRFRSLMCSIQ